MNTVLILLAFVVGVLIGYVIALTLEFFEKEREINDIEMRMSELRIDIETADGEIKKLKKEMKEYERD